MKINKAVTDLGQSSYVKMHGFKCIGKMNRNWYFEMKEEDANQFEQLKIDYVNSPYHAFDHELMSLKKLSEYLPETNKPSKSVTDLGISSFLKMHGFKCIGKKNRNWYFEVGNEDTNQFEQLKIDYINSPYHAFDHELMSLKKVGDYLPEGKDM